MDEASFFKTITTQYNNKLPFVVYSRPINSVIKCWLQKDVTLHNTENFTESGFVFSPFNLDNHSILLPEASCKHYILEVNALNSSAKSNAVIATKNDKQTHLKLVSDGIDAIKSGKLEKVVLSRCEKKTLKNIDPITLFKTLFNTYKNAMVYCWYHPKVGLWLGATPELLFKVEGKKLTSISLAGTKKFNDKVAVKWTAKELEEQNIVTKYITKTIAPLSDKITVKPLETVKAGNLLHLKTYIISRLKAIVTLKSIIETLHPTPAVCGFPKETAKAFIIKNENYNRSFYTGFLGELNLKHITPRNTNQRNVENNAYKSIAIQSNFYVNLRCMQIVDNEALLYVGGGITKDSDALLEWEETVNKTQTIGNILS